MNPLDLVKKHIKDDQININREYIAKKQLPDQFYGIDKNSEKV